MTPEQQAALRSQIHANPAFAEALASRDSWALAAILSAGRSSIQPRFVTARTILAECGALGPSILDALEAASAGNSAVKWAVRFLGQDSGLDVGNPVTQYMIDQLVTATVLTADQGAALKGLAIAANPVSAHDIANAVFNDDGSLK
jgi:hypothetical protein